MGGRAFRSPDTDAIMTWKFPTFPTREAAIDFAAKHGVTVQGAAA
jgi:hypothetical protein